MNHLPPRDRLTQEMTQEGKNELCQKKKNEWNFIQNFDTDTYKVNIL